MSALDKYRIKSPTMVLFFEDQEERHIARVLPAGTVIVLDSATFNGNKLIEVLWDDKKVMMFTQDIRARGEKVT